MGAVIGDLLPLAVGIAISPVPIIAVILILLSDRAAATGTGFLIGWVAGVVAVTVVVLALVGQADDTEGGGESSTLSAVLDLVFGLLLLLLALRQWQGRPKNGEAGTMPKWMGAVTSFTFGQALGLGFLLAGINPKNLLLCLGAGTTIGAAGLSSGEVVVAVAVFTVLASITVGVPVIGYLIARDRMAAPLDRLRTWLTRNNAVVMAVLLLVLGVGLVGRGIAGF
jgi:threonine/homoserine/homoserine lactone efflux protein